MNTSRADSSAGITFTNRGEWALDELATVLTAHCSNTPEGIARVLDEVMHTSLDDLAAALSAITAAADRRHQLHVVEDRGLALVDQQRPGSGERTLRHSADAPERPRSVAR
jgi:hypothetical protein